MKLLDYGVAIARNFFDFIDKSRHISLLDSELIFQPLIHLFENHTFPSKRVYLFTLGLKFTLDFSVLELGFVQAVLDYFKLLRKLSGTVLA